MLVVLLFVYSGPDDYVFVNMVDHGGVGIFAFPGFVMVSLDCGCIC